MITQKDDEDGDDIERKDAWQVVSCPQCRAPIGMRCKSAMMKTHSPRKKAFFDKLNEHLEEKARAKIERKIATKIAAPKPPKGSIKDNKEVRQSQHRQPVAPKQSQPAQNSTANRSLGHNQLPLPSSTENWSALAAQLRAENSMRPVNPLSIGAGFAGSNSVKNSIKEAPPVRQMNTAERTRNDNEVWKSTPCPLCRVGAGVRCVDTLGQTRLQSHAQRVGTGQKN